MSSTKGRYFLSSSAREYKIRVRTADYFTTSKTVLFCVFLSAWSGYGLLFVFFLQDFMSCQGQVVVFFAYSEESYFLLLLALTSTLLPVYIFKKPISLMRKKFTQPFSPQPLNTRLIGFSLRFKKFPRKCLFSWKFLKSPSLTSTKKMIKLLVYAWFSYILALLAFNTFCLRVTLSLEIFSSLPSCLSLKSSSTFSPKFL